MKFNIIYNFSLIKTANKQIKLNISISQNNQDQKNNNLNENNDKMSILFY